MQILFRVFFFSKNSKPVHAGPETQLFLISTLIVTLLRGGGGLGYSFLLQKITNDPATISTTHFLNPSISLRDSGMFWPKTETRCSYTIVLIQKACTYASRLIIQLYMCPISRE